jgi:predicted O-methyltransferase YrrM
MLDFEGYRDGAAAQRGEGELLYALVRSTEPEYCVETGTHKGLTASYISQALSDNGKGWLDTCDPIEWEAKGNLQRFEGVCAYHQIRGVDLAPKQSIDFLFIDGFHEKEEVMSEWGHFYPHLSENAIVVFHDCHDPDKGHEMAANVNGAVRELGIDTVLIPTANRMRIYFHGKDSTKKTYEDIGNNPEHKTRRAGGRVPKPTKTNLTP